MQFTRVAQVVIAASELAAPLRFYRDVLGLPATPTTTIDGAAGVLLPVGESAITLVKARQEPYASFVAEHGEGIHHLLFESDNVVPLLPRDQHFGLGIAAQPADAPGRQMGLPTSGVQNIDHVVISSGDSATVAAHFRENFGIEIKRTMSRPGTRSHLEFAKLVDVILEFAGPPEPRPGPIQASYWGIVFCVADIHKAIELTRQAGIRCDDPKTAVQPGALIASVKESTGGVPFAFIQYNAIPVA